MLELKNNSLNRVNEILEKEIFTSDNLTIGDVIKIISGEWSNINTKQQKDICIAIAGKRKGNDIAIRGYFDYILNK